MYKIAALHNFYTIIYIHKYNLEYATDTIDYVLINIWHSGTWKMKEITENILQTNDDQVWSPHLCRAGT